MAEQVEISVVVPMYNEAEVIGLLFDRLLPVVSALTPAYEIICVNDGSTDRTLELALAARARDPRIKVINLSRNFGKEAALTAGIRHSRGHAVVPIDADLQHPPELIAELVARWRDGYDIVMVVRSDRDDESLLKRLTTNAFYRLMGHVSEVPIRPHVSDFCLLDRQVVDALAGLPERTRFMKGLFAWLGFRQAVVNYVPAPRAAGATKWRYWKLWNFALEGITSFTSFPLRIWTYVGFVTATAALLYAVYITLKTLILGVEVPGFASLIVLLLFFNGLNMLSTGILGEYLARVFVEVKRRPLYLVRDRHGLEEAAVQSPEDDR